MLVHPSEAGEPHECKAWLKQLVLRGASVHIPEIADYELRRELLRMRSDESVRRLDALKARLTYVPITTAAILKAAEHWATGRPMRFALREPYACWSANSLRRGRC